jgi:hypothetical protein
MSDPEGRGHERLNSVLEPSRTLVLAEKGLAEMMMAKNRLIKAHEVFQLFDNEDQAATSAKVSPPYEAASLRYGSPPVTDHFDV